MTSRELVESCLARISTQDDTIQAWARLRAEGARRDADHIDRLSKQEKARLALAGIPVGIKDIFCTSDLETTAGSRILEGWLPEQDAVAVARLRQAGAIILGKTATTEFAYADPAPTRNPVDPGHTPGGSSAGSAAAIAAHMCLGALGTQTAGSILRPASYCGVVGFKPTYDAVSREGVLPLAWSMDHVGPLTKTVEDAALIYEAIGGVADAGGQVVSKLRIGIPDRYFSDATAEVGAAVSNALDVVAGLGWELVPIVLPASFEALVAASAIIIPVEVAAVHQDWCKSSADLYGPKLRACIEAGRTISATSYLRVQRIRRQATDEFQQLFDKVDLIATPTVPAPAPKGIETTGDPRYCTPFSCLGMPALNIPVRAETTHLPVGLQLVAPHGADRLLLKAGRLLEEHLPAPQKAAEAVA